MASANPVGILVNQTNINKSQYFFLEANISSLNVNNISTGNITANSISCLTGQISSLLTNFISSANGEINELTTSTISTTQLDLDGQTLNATATELLLNGIPLATTSNLSSIGDWALDEAVSSINVNGYDVLNANIVSSVRVNTGTISTQTIYANTINAINLVAFNIFAFSTYTSTLSSAIEVADQGLFSSISTGDAFIGSLSSIISDTQLANISSLTAGQSAFSSVSTDILSTGSLLVSTIATDSLSVSSIIAEQGSISSLNLSTINGQPISFYGPTPTISSFLVLNASTLNAGNISTTAIASGGFLRLNAGLSLNANAIDAINIAANRGGDILGNGKITLLAKNGVQGEVDITADTGIAGIGGVVNINANGGVTPLGFGYGGEINLTATTGSFTSLALTSAVNLNAAGINSYAGATAPIGSIAGGNFVHGDSIVNITAGVPPIFSDPLCVYLRGTNGILLDSDIYAQGPIRPYSDLVQNPVDLYIEAYNNLITTGYIQLRGVSTQTFYGGDSAVLGLNRLQFSSIAGALENVSSINGQPITFYEPGGVSTISTFSDLFTSSLTASSIQTLDANVSSVVGLSSLNGMPISVFQNVSSISSLNEWALYPALSTIAFASGTPAVIQSGNPNIDNITLEGSNIHLVAGFTDAKNLLLVSTMSTAVIEGANASIFAPLLLGTPGLKIDAQNIFFSTVQTNITGLINASSISAFEGRIKTVTCSTLNAFNGVNTTGITSLGGTLQISTIAGVDFVNTAAVSFFVPQVYLTYPGNNGITHASTISTNQVFSEQGSISTLTISTLNGHPYTTPTSAYQSTILISNLSTFAQPIASTSITLYTSSYVLAQANTTIKNLVNQYHDSFFYITIDGSTGPSTVTTLVNKSGFHSGQTISFRTYLGPGTWSVIAEGYADANGDLQVTQCELWATGGFQ